MEIVHETHLHGQAVFLDSLTLKMNKLYSFKTSGTIYPATQPNNPRRLASSVTQLQEPQISQEMD
jgi:hypothetical protein